MKIIKSILIVGVGILVISCEQGNISVGDSGISLSGGNIQLKSGDASVSLSEKGIGVVGTNNTQLTAGEDGIQISTNSGNISLSNSGINIGENSISDKGIISEYGSITSTGIDLGSKGKVNTQGVKDGIGNISDTLSRTSENLLK